MNSSSPKSDRLLQIYSLLTSGEIVNKKELAQRFNVTERSIQRDIESLRCFLVEQGLQQDIVYVQKQKGFHLINSTHNGLTNSEIFAVCKILLESRSMTRAEMEPLLDRLIACSVPVDSQKEIRELIANEKFHYVEPHHGQRILDTVWDLGSAIQLHQIVELEYARLKGAEVVKRRVLPVGIMFSEYYFYLTAFLEHKETFANPDDLFPTIYRVDRIRKLNVLKEQFFIPYKDRFEEGQFRKRVQFMYGGRLSRVKFKYYGPSIEAVLDRLPTAEIIETGDDWWTVQAEVFGKGIDMWLRSQGDYIEVLEM